jgi:hypothetical protein
MWIMGVKEIPDKQNISILLISYNLTMTTVFYDKKGEK